MPEVYDGQRHCGSVTAHADRFVAVDATGKRIGVFATRLEAVDACLRATRRPEPEERDTCIDEAGLVEAIERFMRAKP